MQDKDDFAIKNNNAPIINAVKEDVADNFKHSLNLKPFLLLNRVGNLKAKLTVKINNNNESKELAELTIKLVSIVEWYVFKMKFSIS